MLLRWSREYIPVKRRIVSIMVGRPRKLGKRHPNGQLVRLAYENPKKQVAMQPHRQEVMKEYREWPEAESQFGRLMLMGKITPAQHEAGKRYFELANQAIRLYTPLSPHPTGLDMDRVSGGGHDGDIPRHVAQAIKDRYNAAFDAIGHTRQQRTIKECVFLDKMPADPTALSLLITGLNALVRHFHVDPDLKISRTH